MVHAIARSQGDLWITVWEGTKRRSPAMRDVIGPIFATYPSSTYRCRVLYGTAGRLCWIRGWEIAVYENEEFHVYSR